MSTSSPAAERRSSTGMPLLPPEEKFWKRYSPQNEAPLSGITSAVLHILVLGLLLLVIWVQSKLKLDEEYSPVPVEPVRLGGGSGPIGDGDPNGQIGDPKGKEPDAPLGPPPPQHLDITPAVRSRIQDALAPDARDTNAWSGIASDAVGSLGRLEDEMLKALGKSLKPGGGRGGRDKGDDRGVGPDKGTLSQQEKRIQRVLRWGMGFSTRDGNDYKDQLAGLEAMVAFRSQGQFILIRDLNQPASAKAEDISTLNRIFWIDDKSESVRSLFSVLGHPKPDAFVAYFPYKLEKRLLELELDFLKRKFDLSDENRIQETKFEVFRSGTTYDVRVKQVYLKR